MSTEYKSLREKISAETQERRKRYQGFEAAWAQAVTEGNKAAQEVVPPVMVVEQHANPLDDNSEVVNSWTVPDGPCGFAEVRISKGNTSFARWAKKNAGFRKHYYGGLSYWVSAFGQSMVRKEAFARKAAEVLQSHGIDAFSSSRMD